MAVVPMPWIAADKPTPASWNEFGDGASFGFSPSQGGWYPIRKPPFARGPLWYSNFTIVWLQDPDSMLPSLYRATLAARRTLLTAADTSCL